MNIDELCSAFLDNALTPEQEGELFRSLSVSPEKRDVLRSYGSLKAVAQKDALATTVPAQLDERVFAGIAALQGGVVAPAAGGAAVGTTGFWTTSRAFLTALAAILLLTAGYFIHGFSFSEGEGSAGRTPPAERSAMLPDLSGRASGRAVARDLPLSGGGGSRSLPVRIVERRIPVVRVDTLRTDPELVVRRDTIYVERRDTLRLAAEPAPAFREAAAEIPRWEPRGLLQSLDVALMREHQQTYPYIAYSELGTKRMQQVMEVEAAYRFDANHAIGVAFGEKVFSQEFYRIAADSLFIIQQQPSFLYGGAFYRFTLPLSERFAPQIALHVGGTSVGPVLGARIGIAFTPLAHFQILFGGNGSLLIYKLDQNVFNSYSLGLFYGLRYSF